MTTLTTSTSRLKGTPNLIKSPNAKLPGVMTSGIAGEETGIMKAVDAGQAEHGGQFHVQRAVIGSSVRTINVTASVRSRLTANIKIAAASKTNTTASCELILRPERLRFSGTRRGLAHDTGW